MKRVTGARMNARSAWIFLVLAIVFNASASVLLKSATVPSRHAQWLAGGGSIVCYGLSFLTYYACLRTLPVSIAYPVITGGAILAIVIASTVFLGESLSGVKLLGATLVILGAMLLLREH